MAGPKVKNGDELVRVNLFSVVDALTSPNGNERRRAKAWCVFFDTNRPALLTASGRVSGMGEFDKLDNFLHGFFLSNPLPVKNKNKVYRAEANARVGKKRKEGFEIVDGEWYISIRGGRLFNAHRMDRSEVDVLPIRDCGIDGFGSGSGMSAPAAGNLTQFDPSVYRRLAEANPIANSWFFAA